MPLDLLCEHCTGSFTVPPSRSGARYCSTTCYRLAHAKVLITCETCGTSVLVYPSEVAEGRRFCSKRCARLSQGRMDEKACGICGETFQPTKTGAMYCSAPCRQIGNARSSVAMRAEMLRGRGDGKAYRKREGRHEHRVVAEETLGRALLPGEIVHHINGDHRDNRPENLQVLPSQAEHARIHSVQRWARTKETA